MHNFVINKDGILLVEMIRNSSRLTDSPANPGKCWIEAKDLVVSYGTEIRIFLTHTDTCRGYRWEVEIPKKVADRP